MTKAEKAKTPPGQLTERLNEALDRKGWSRWRFQREMAARRTPGSSRANIDRYLKGEVSKLPVRFLIEAADVLDVNLLWLLGESPAMTKEDAVSWEATTRRTNQQLLDRVERELQRTFPLYRRLDKAARGAIWNAWKERLIRLSRERAEGEPLAKDAVEAAANDLGRALMGPLKAYNVDQTELFLWDLGHYATAVCQALAFLKQRGPGRVASRQAK